MNKEIFAVCMICFFVYGLSQLPTKQSPPLRVNKEIAIKETPKKVMPKKPRVEPIKEPEPAPQKEKKEACDCELHTLPKDHWAYDYVSKGLEAGELNCSDALHRPNDAVERAQLYRFPPKEIIDSPDPFYEDIEKKEEKNETK